MKINKRNIIRKQNRFEQTRKTIEDSQLKAVRGLIPDNRVQELCKEKAYKYRRRKITPLVSLLHMIGAAISREGSFQSSWQNSGRRNRGQRLFLDRARQKN